MGFGLVCRQVLVCIAQGQSDLQDSVIRKPCAEEARDIAAMENDPSEESSIAIVLRLLRWSLSNAEGLFVDLCHIWK
jgi:hypothetical protein